MADFSNVFCKISGMVTEAKWRQWKQGDFKIHLNPKLELFGPERFMYESDWQVCFIFLLCGYL